MNITNNCIKKRKQEHLTFGHESYNFDFIIPDYYPDINKILKCSVVPRVEAITTSADKVSVSGEASVNVIYLSDDNRILCYENSIKYTKVFQTENLNENEFINAIQEVISKNVRALGPKRINVNGTIEIKLSVIGTENKEFIENIEDAAVQTKKNEISLFDVSCSVQKTVSVNKTVNCEAADKISGVLRKDCSLNINETRVINGKTYINGYYSVKLITISDECKVNTITFEIPVSEVVDTFASKEIDECFITNIDNNLNILIKNSGEKQDVIEVTVNSTFMLTCGNYIKLNLIDDVYSVYNELITEMTTDMLSSEITRHNQILSVACEINAADDIKDIMDAYISNMRLTFEKNDDKNQIVLDAVCGVMYTSNDGGFRFSEEKITSEFLLKYNGVDSRFNISDIKVLSCSALQILEGKIKFTSELSIDYIEDIKCKVNLFTKIDTSTVCNNENKCGIVLYFAHKDEDVWDIAKENKTTVKQVKEINNLSDERLSDDLLLILPKF